MEFIKNLSRSEAKYKYVGLTKEARQEFPETGKNFKLRFRNKTYEMWVNSKNCFMISQLYKIYEFQENDQIKITSKPDGSFELTVG